MTWILPKNLHTSVYVQDMEVLTLDLKECSQICEQSLLVRSKPMPSQTWLRKWNKDSWMQHLFGRILKPFHGQTFTEKWTSSVVGFLVNPSQQQDKGKEMKTQGIYSHISKEELNLSDLPLFSLKTFKALSQVNLDQIEKMKKERLFCYMSLGSWKDWVTEQRRAYSVRLNAVHHTNVKESLYLDAQIKPWGSPRTGMSKAPRGQIKKDGIDLKAWSGKLKNQVCQMHGQVIEDKRRSLGSLQEFFPTPTANENKYRLQGSSQASKNLNAIHQGKLNPRWVESLMGIPIGWTMVTCVNPYVIELMNLECLETALYHQQQKKHSESS